MKTRYQKHSRFKALAAVATGILALVGFLWLMRDVIFFWICVFLIFAVL
jgi:hypothetical protein